MHLHNSDADIWQQKRGVNFATRHDGSMNGDHVWKLINFTTRQLSFLSERISGMRQWQSSNLPRVATQWHGWELNPRSSSYIAENSPLDHPRRPESNVGSSTKGSEQRHKYVQGFSWSHLQFLNHKSFWPSNIYLLGFPSEFPWKFGF